MKKVWNSMPITKKLMSVTILVFLVFCLVIFLGQIAFFEKYYTYIKSGEVKKAAEDFARQYVVTDDDELHRSRIAEIADNYECYIMVIGEGGAMKYMLSYDMTVKTSEGEVIRISLDSAAQDKDFKALGLDVGDKATVKYIAGDEANPQRTFFPVSIENSVGEWKMPPHKIFGRRDKDSHTDSVRTVEGEIVSLLLPSEQTRNINAERGAAFKAAGELIYRMSSGEELPGAGKILSYYYTDDETAEEFSVVVRDLPDSDGDVVFAIAPLAMVREAVDVTRNMYVIWFLLAMAAACALGIIFSRMLTKPLLEITDVTKKMAALDFGCRCECSSNDEVGELAANINILSDALDRTINELQAANEKLTADIERERAVEKSRREFVAAASHELKTPLGIIRAYTEALIDGVSENKRQRYTQVIVDETEKMDRLILDMLDNSKLEAGAQELVIANYDICAQLAGVLHRFDEMMKQKSITATIDIPDKPIVKNFDADMIERVMSNFITNAVHNTPDGGNIICRAESNADGSVTISVENSGSHIDEGDIEHIWDRFYKADKSRRRSSGGTGLGLSIAKNILLLHGAEYGAFNTQTGVKFEFTLK